jgi:hypothetical protein
LPELLAAVLLTISAGAAHAGPIHGTAPAICATVETFECVPNGDCIKDSPEAIALPRFIRLDFATKQAVAERISGGPLTAEIMSQRVEAGRVVLQGIQNGNGWSLAVTQETGAMSLAISSDGVGYIVFGSRTKL